MIAFHYKSYPHYPFLVALGIATLLGLAVWPYRRKLAARIPSGSRGAGNIGRAVSPAPHEGSDPVAVEEHQGDQYQE